MGISNVGAHRNFGTILTQCSQSTACQIFDYSTGNLILQNSVVVSCGATSSNHMLPYWAGDAPLLSGGLMRPEIWRAIGIFDLADSVIKD